MIPVMIVEDHPLVTEGLINVINKAEGLELKGIAMKGRDCISLLPDFQQGVILMDIKLPDISGIELCKEVKKRNKALKIVALTTYNQQYYVNSMIENGALGYVLKNAEPHEIIEAILCASENKHFFSKEVMKQIRHQEQHAIYLSKREIEVLKLIAEGLTNSQIAEKLFVSPLTIDSHRKNLILKTGTKNTASLIKFAVEEGYIEHV
ncbi:MAG: response regulator [Bacteroidota bacterium]